MLIADIAVIWIGVLVFSFVVIFAGALSIQDKQNDIITGGLLLLLFSVGIVSTLGLLVGFVPQWQ